MKQNFSILLALAALCLATDTTANDLDNAPLAEFARVDVDSHGNERALQVAVMRYRLADSTSPIFVDLISAVHIGDKDYYRELNKRFRDYDVLLYEMVISTPDQSRLQTTPDSGFVSKIQIHLKDALGLAFQLEEIDYEASNFIHADLTAAALLQRMDERGESMYVYFWRVFYAAIDDYARDPLGLQDFEIMSRLLAADDDEALKIAIAYEMVKATRSGDFLGDQDGSAIIAARNEHAIGVLQAQLDAGVQRIGIFYGAAHMPDFDSRLTNDLRLRRTSVEWADAWRFSTAQPVQP